MSATESQTLTIDTIIDPMRVAAMHAALGCEGPPPAAGAALPPFWHWGQFWIIAPPDKLGRDGHPAHGGLMPHVGLPRRMWAGGALDFHAAITVGQRASRVTKASEVMKKTGRSGPLAFVTLHHQITQNGTLCVSERQDLVFRDDPAPDAPARPAKMASEKAELRKGYCTTAVDLFRYSALTFNGHRIHYDRQYAQEVEGYDGLIVHGPLLAQRMIEMAVETLGTIAHFTFRAEAPVFDHQSYEVRAESAETGLRLWVAREDGVLAMTGEAR